MYARPATRDRDYDRLLRRSYGLAPAGRHGTVRRGRAVTLTADAGTEVLPQPGVASAGSPEPVEYVVDREPAGLPQPVPSTPSPAPAPAPADPDPVTAPLPAYPPASEPAAPSASPPAGDGSVALPASLASSPLTTDDLAADVRAILSGAASAPPAPPAAAAGPPGGPAPAARTQVEDPGRPMPEKPNEQAIFDKIAQSMEYANSFDLGSVDLRGRFDQFDRQADARRAPVRTQSVTPPPAPPMTPPTTPPTASGGGAGEPAPLMLPPGSLARLPMVGGCLTSAAALAADPDRSVPMYDTGEHVQAGGDLYPDQLPVNGVPFSYGQLMAMGDLYADVDSLLRAPAAELSTLKALIAEDTGHYTGRGGTGVSNQRWNVATGGRYLALAEDNYAHFAPPSVLGMTDATTRPDHRSEWERYHERAIAEMRAIVAAAPDASPAPFGPLATNAFGDHFLTDAFAAGHLVNKEVVMERVRGAFYSGATTLTPAGSAFLDRLAAACWARKPVRDVFSPLEQYEGVLGIKHFNFDTQSMFRRLLGGIAEQAPAKVLNLPLKALHDHLNEVGVEVTNDAGERPWQLKGDGHLSETGTLAVMKRAVQQSVDNILSPEILVSEPDQGPLSRSAHPTLVARVWRHVPYPTAAGRAQAVAALTTYTDLGSAVLLNAAAEVIEKQAPFIAQELIDRKVLRHEDGPDREWNGSSWQPRGQSRQAS